MSDKIYEKLLEILEKQDEILKEQQEMKKEQKEMKKEQQQMRKDFQVMTKRQDKMEEELIKIGNVVTRIEYEHGRKIDLILEVLAGHEEKFVQYDERYEKDHKVLEMYGHRIYALEQKCKQ